MPAPRAFRRTPGRQLRRHAGCSSLPPSISCVAATGVPLSRLLPAPPIRLLRSVVTTSEVRLHSRETHRISKGRPVLIYVNHFRLAEDVTRQTVVDAVTTWLTTDRNETGLSSKALFLPDDLLLPSGARLSIVATPSPPLLYSLTYTHSDPATRGRTWTTEIGMRYVDDHVTDLSVRLATQEVSTRARTPIRDPLPSVIRLWDAANIFSPDTPGSDVKLLDDEWAAEGFQITVHAPDRKYACVVMSAAPSGGFPIDPEVVRRNVVGLAEVVKIPSGANTNRITDVMGKDFSAWTGAINIILAPREGAPHARTVKLLPSEMATIADEGSGIVARILEVITDRSNPVLDHDHISSVSVRKALLSSPSTKVLSIIAAGESSVVEFKSSLRWNTHAGRRDETMTQIVMKTVAAFLNSEGGTLLIGVEDAGTICGIQHDQFDNSDKFLLFLMDKLKAAFGLLAASHVKATVVDIGSASVCVVECHRSDRLVFIQTRDSERDKEREACYIRQGPRTIELPPSAIIDYDRTRSMSAYQTSKM